jgi:hypothetical protein
MSDSLNGYIGNRNPEGGATDCTDDTDAKITKRSHSVPLCSLCLRGSPRKITKRTHDLGARKGRRGDREKGGQRREFAVGREFSKRTQSYLCVLRVFVVHPPNLRNEATAFGAVRLCLTNKIPPRPKPLPSARDRARKVTIEHGRALTGTLPSEAFSLTSPKTQQKLFIQKKSNLNQKNHPPPAFVPPCRSRCAAK